MSENSLEKSIAGLQMEVLTMRVVAHLLLVFLVLFCTSLAAADPKAPAPTPSMEETVSWLVSALQNVGGGTGWMACIYKDRQGQCTYQEPNNEIYFSHRVTVNISYEDVTINNCLLKLKQISRLSVDNEPTQVDATQDLLVSFKYGYDPAFMVVDRLDSAPGARDESYSVQLKLSATGQFGDVVSVKNREMAQRIGNAMSHLVILCGWKAQPF